ncbi:hypothetical protein GIB67_015476, partial [Kingdonia uniflora]
MSNVNDYMKMLKSWNMQNDQEFEICEMGIVKEIKNFQGHYNLLSVNLIKIFYSN